MKNKTTHRLGNKKLVSIPKHDSLKYCSKTKKQCQKSYVNTICKSINQSHYLDHFPICQEANSVSKVSTCADNLKHYTTENCTSSYQTHVTEVVKDITKLLKN